MFINNLQPSSASALVLSYTFHHYDLSSILPVSAIIVFVCTGANDFCQLPRPLYLMYRRRGFSGLWYIRSMYVVVRRISDSATKDTHHIYHW